MAMMTVSASISRPSLVCSPSLSMRSVNDRPLDIATQRGEVVDLLLVGGRTLHVDGGDLFRAHGIGAERHVHAGVAGADDDHLPADLGIFAVIDRLQEVKPLDQPLMAGERDHHRVVGAAGDNQRVVFVLHGGEGVLVDLLGDTDIHSHLLDAVRPRCPESRAADVPWGWPGAACRRLPCPPSNRVTPWPSRLSCQAAERPPGPPPMTATFLPVSGFFSRRRRFLGELAQFLHGHRMVDELAAAGILAQVGADLAADAGRERGIGQYQLQRFLDLALAQQVDAVLGRDAGRDRRSGRVRRKRLFCQWGIFSRSSPVLTKLATRS